MNKLKTVINDYGSWSGLDIYVDRIEAHIESDFSLSLENAKALLETIGKQICDTYEVELGTSPTINTVLRNSFSSLGYRNDSLVNQVSRSLANIGQQLGDLRNEIGITSHGKTLEEVEERNSKVDVLTREFLIDAVELVSVFLIRNFEAKHDRTPQELVDTLDYLEAEEFNEFWDDSFGEFSMVDYSYPASEILFNVDKQAYVNEYKAFVEAEE